MNGFLSFIKGVLTAKEVHEVLSNRGWLHIFPLFSAVHAISTGRLPPSAIVKINEENLRYSIYFSEMIFHVRK